MEQNDQKNGREPETGKAAVRVAAATAAAGLLAKAASAELEGQAALLDLDPPRVLVQLYLRGGADGFSLCVPNDEANYHLHRDKTRIYHPDDTSAPAGTNAIPLEPPILDAGGNIVRTGFGLAPAFAGMKNLYLANKLCFVHACGSLDPTRSHFAQQAFTELGEITATPNKDGDGWLGRYLQNTDPRGDGTLRALAFGTVKITSYNGGKGVTPTAEPHLFDYPAGQPLKDHLTTLYGASPGSPVQDSLEDDIGAIDKLQAVNWGTIPGGFSVLRTQFRRAFEVIRDVPDIEIITIDYDNIAGQRWDTHNDQGVFDGTMANLMTDLSDTIQAFVAEVGTIMNRKVVVLIYTEFGRTLQENTGCGTDHGRGGVAMLVGDDVTSGQVYTHDWPTLDYAALDPPGASGDLAVTLDIRDIQAEVITKCLGGVVEDIFPDDDYEYMDHGLITPI